MGRIIDWLLGPKQWLHQVYVDNRKLGRACKSYQEFKSLIEEAQKAEQISKEANIHVKRVFARYRAPALPTQTQTQTQTQRPKKKVQVKRVQRKRKGRIL